MRSRDQVSRVESVGGTPFHVCGVLAYINPRGRLPSIVKEFPCPVLAILVASAGALAGSSIPQPIRYLGCRGPSLRPADFLKTLKPKPQEYESHDVTCGFSSNLRAKDAKRDRGKQAANTCIDRAHGCLRCALTVSQVSCAVATALFSSSFDFVLRVGAV